MAPRGCGPGPLTGALAILITDTGTFGKIFSDALENVDEKQIEGVGSTGAKPVQRYRFGVIPQVTPVLLAQILYFLGSNTRWATILGAITGCGIGLLLTQAMQTQKAWEEVAYYIGLVVIMVMVMDWFSGLAARPSDRPDGAGARVARLSAEQPVVHDDVSLTQAQLGRFVEIGKGSRIAYADIGDYSYCDRYADIANATIGTFANLASFSRIGATGQPMDTAALHHFLSRSSHCRGDAKEVTGRFGSSPTMSPLILGL